MESTLSPQGFSHTIDVVDLSNMDNLLVGENYITIETPLANSISDCSSIPFNGEIIIISDLLIKDNKMVKENGEAEPRWRHENLFRLRFNEEKKEASVEPFSSSSYMMPLPYIGYSCHINFWNGNEQIIIPEFIEYVNEVENGKEKNGYTCSSVISVKENKGQLEVSSYRLPIF